MRVTYIGLDIGGTLLKAGLVDPAGQVVHAARLPAHPEDSDRLLSAIEELILRVSDGVFPDAIGVGVPGLLSARTNRIEVCPNLPALNGMDLAAALSDRTGRPVFIGNDADLNAWGEYRVGAGVGTASMIGLTIGTGLGSGLIFEGKLYSGAGGYGAEAGHIAVDIDGRPCGCGSHGCLETVVSAPAIVNVLRQAIHDGADSRLRDQLDRLTAKHVFEAARHGDKLAGSICHRVGRYLGMACASLMNLLNPEMIVLGGGVAAAGPTLLTPLAEEARARSYAQTFEACRIVPGRLGNEAGVIGAALFASSHEE